MKYSALKQIREGFVSLVYYDNNIIQEKNQRPYFKYQMYLVEINMLKYVLNKLNCDDVFKLLI